MAPTTTSAQFDRMAGQRMMVGIDGTHFAPRHRELIDRFQVGGVILFSRNVETPDQVRELCGRLQDTARSRGLPPLLIAVDQEGGPVARLRPPHFTAFAGNPAVRDAKDADRFAEVTAGELLDIGINMNMAPVLDVAPSNMASIMAARSFGGDPAWVATMGCRVIRGFQQRGVMAVAKHFPGIGGTIVDSHLDMPVFHAELTDLQRVDLPPFEAALRESVAGVMLSHIHYDRIDPRWPASMSETIVSGLLRDRLGYQGVVFTDDLDMGAVQRHFDIPTVARRVVAADIDIALVCHEGPAIEAAWNEIRKQIRANDIEIRRARTSYQRVLDLKERFLGLQKAPEDAGTQKPK